jgi:hypothetical protein
VARHVSEARKHAAALQAARRLIAPGERPGYRLRTAQDGSWAVEGNLGVTVTADTKRTALTAARAAIAAVLEVDPESFDLEGQPPGCLG